MSSMTSVADNITAPFDKVFSHKYEKTKNGIYKGQKLKGKRDGMGVIRYKNSDIYFGDVREGIPHGAGVYVCNVGNEIRNCPGSKVFVGKFKNGQKSKGRCLDEESEVVYSGVFENDIPSDISQSDIETENHCYFDRIDSPDNGWVYVGELSQGTPDGKGAIITNNGDCIISDFSEGIRTGIGLTLTSNGEWQTEKSKNGEIRVISSSAYYAAIDSERNRQFRSSLSDALGYFSQALVKTSEAVAIASGQTMEINDAVSYSQSASQTDSGSSGNYQSDYSKWETLAERHYNSLTNIGSSRTDSDGSKNGTAGKDVSSGNYVSMKKSFREAQKQMARIRHKAAKAGITIAQSKWETATVSY